MGAFYNWGAMLGCDASACYPQTQFDVGGAMEYVRTGMRAPPEDADYGECVSPAMVPVIERRPVHGRLRARFAYSTDECTNWEEAIVEFDVPAEGVCCPVGGEGLGTDVPAGGWAPTSDGCWSWSGESSWIRVEDPRGCPALVSLNSSRGICDDYDGGVVVDY